MVRCLVGGEVSIKMPATPPKLPPQHWLDFLSDLSHRLPIRMELHCAGAFAASARYGIGSLLRRELDYIATRPPSGTALLERGATKGSALARQHRLSLRFYPAEFIEDYEKRLAPIFAGRFPRLRLYAMEAHDLALSTLGSSRATDSALLRALTAGRLLRAAVLEKRYVDSLRPYIADPKPLDRIFARWMNAYFAAPSQRVQ